MSGATLFAFWAFSLLFVVTPGADWAYAIAAGIRGKGVFPAVVGLLAGYVVLTVIVAAGVGVLIASQPMLMSALTVAGSCYMGWLGLDMLRNPPVPKAAGEEANADTWTSWALKGAFVSGLNPKAFLFFLAFLPPWTANDASWSIPVQIVALGLIHTASCSVVYSLVGVGAKLALGTRPSAALIIGRMSGVVMFSLGVLLMYRAIIAH